MGRTPDAVESAMPLDLVRSFYRYSAWANTRILDTAAALDPTRFVAAAGPGGESIRDTLVHTLGAQWLYLERWQGRSPRALPAPGDFAALDAVRARWEEIERATAAFVAGLTDVRLAAVIEYENFEGQRWAYPLWQQMLHQVNHATQHRSEAAVMLTQAGHSPGWLDYLYWIDMSGAAA
jgi:uncharacterized damage-inducible protein DinB